MVIGWVFVVDQVDYESAVILPCYYGDEVIRLVHGPH